MLFLPDIHISRFPRHFSLSFFPPCRHVARHSRVSTAMFPKTQLVQHPAPANPAELWALLTRVYHWTWAGSRKMFEGMGKAWVRERGACFAARHSAKTRHLTRHFTLHGTLDRHRQRHRHRQHLPSRSGPPHPQAGPGAHSSSQKILKLPPGPIFCFYEHHKS